MLFCGLISCVTAVYDALIEEPHPPQESENPVNQLRKSTSFRIRKSILIVLDIILTAIGLHQFLNTETNDLLALYPVC